MSKPEVIVITGGAGYIGSHTVREFLKTYPKVIVIDDLSKGLKSHVPDNVILFESDFADEQTWQKISEQYVVEGVVHLAAFIDANESVKHREDYFANNFTKTEQLLKILTQNKIEKFVFASTASVYGEGINQIFTETSPLNPTNPYGESKRLAEVAIENFCHEFGLKAVALRFFNIGGTLPDINILPTADHALFGKLKDVISGRSEFLPIYGNKHNTFDGTCIRDFVHVADIARGVVTALSYLKNHMGFEVFNIGTGTGYSVKQIILGAEKVLGRSIPVRIFEARENEVVVSVADNTKIKNQLGFSLQFSDLENIIKSSL